MSAADDRRRIREAQVRCAQIAKTGTPAEIISALSSVRYQVGRVEVTSRVLASGPRKGETIYSLHVHPRTHRDPAKIRFGVRSKLHMSGLGDLVDSGRIETLVHKRVPL